MVSQDDAGLGGGGGVSLLFPDSLLNRPSVSQLRAARRGEIGSTWPSVLQEGNKSITFTLHKAGNDWSGIAIPKEEFSVVLVDWILSVEQEVKILDSL